MRKVFIYGKYFSDFYSKQNQASRLKIDCTIELVRSLAVVPEKFLKHITGSDGLYEIRVKSGSNIFRIFCFFDEAKLIILLNGFQKKSVKTPVNQIAKAERLKKAYYEEKKQN